MRAEAAKGARSVICCRRKEGIQLESRVWLPVHMSAKMIFAKK